MKKVFTLLIALLLATASSWAQTTDFTSFTTGSVNYQGTGGTIVTGTGYTIPNPYGSLWTVADEWGSLGNFDQEVKDDGTGNKVWRISNAIVNGSFANQPYSPSSPLAAGETTAALYNDRGPNHTTPLSPPNPRAIATTKYFHGGFKFKSVTGAAQPGLTLTVSPAPRQGNVRMSYVRIDDSGAGFDLTFYETLTGGAFPDNGTTIASNLSYADWHQVDIYIKFLDGFNGDGTGNDIVTVMLDGVVVQTGTTWETYFAYSGEWTATPVPIAVDALLFRVAAAALGISGNGLYFDDVTVDNAQVPVVAPPTPITTIEASSSSSCGILDVPVTVRDFRNVGAISLTLNYEVTKLELLPIDPEAGPPYPGVTLNPAIPLAIPSEITAGKFKLSDYPDPAISIDDNEVLFTLHFNILPAAGTTAALTWNTSPRTNCEYAGPGGAPVYVSSFINNLLVAIPPRPVKNINTGREYCTIQAAINDPATNDLPGDLDDITVDATLYSAKEQVIVNKEVTITGINGQPTVEFLGTVTGKPTLFDISANNVTIDNIHFNVDLSKLRSAIIASAAGIDNITVKNNLIDAYGTPAGSFGDRNAVSINYTGSTNYRVATGGVNSITFTGNNVNGTLPSSFFRAGVAVDEGGGTFLGNTLQTISHDILLRFGSNGAVTITGNNLNGGGIELADQNAAAGTFTVSSNIFTGGASDPTVALLRIKNNYNSIPHIVSLNTFNYVDWAVSLENMNSITLNGNTFSSAVATAHAVVVNTKSITTNSSDIVQVPIGAIFTNNNFNGTGTALTFQNHDSDNDSYGTITIGTAGNENNFAATLSSFITLDGQTGSSDLSTIFPNYPVIIGTGGTKTTTMACWDQNLNAQNNNFNVGAGLQLPTAMNFAGLTTLELKLTHKPDNDCLGYITYFYPVYNFTKNTYHMTIQEAVGLADPNNKIICSEWLYKEKVILDKSLWLTGVDETNCVIDGTGLGMGSGISINNGLTGVKIEYFTVKNHTGAGPNSYAGIYAVGGNDNLTVQHCTIKDNLGGSGVYANGPINIVMLDDLSISGHTNIAGPARGIAIWNGLKSNITVTNCEVFNNNCCGIELQDGTASGVLMENNQVYDNGDSGFGLIGLQGPGENLIKGNTVTNNGRFGIEIKNPDGSGLTTGAGRIVVENNTVSRSVAIVDARDIVGIAAFRRGVLAGNVDVPTGVVIQNNTVSGYVQASTSDGFGIVVEGTNHTVSGNTVSGNDVGIQQQVNPSGYSGDADQSNLADQYFGRGNSPITCGITMTGNIFSSNGTVTRNVGTVGGVGFVVNTTTGKTFCSIQAAIDDGATATGHTLQVSAGTFNENVVLSKSVTVQGAGPANTILTPLVACSGIGVSITAAGAKLKDLKVTNYTYGVAVSSTDNEINNVESVSNCTGGLELSAGTGNLSVLNSKLNNNTVMGFRKGTAPSISGFLMDNCEVKGNLAQGCFIATTSGAGVGTFDNVTIQNSTISNNKQKGLYFEALSIALLKNLTMDNNGTDATYNNNCGIDINLKYHDYVNITISDCDITNSGSTGTATDPEASAAIAIKARDDAPSYNTIPATLNNVLIKNNKITGPQNDIRIGEYGKTNATPTNVTIEGNDLSYSFANKVLISRINSDISVICNWHGTTDLTTISGTFTKAGSGNIVLTTVLNIGGDLPPAVGFQPSGDCVGPIVLICPPPANEAACQTQAEIDAKFATWLGTVIASGGCSGSLSTDPVTPVAPSEGGSVTVTWTYTSTCAPLTTTCSSTFTVASKSTLSGTLFYFNTELSPMEDVTLKLMPGGAEFTTLNDGKFSFSGLCAGTYTIEVTANGNTDGGINSTDAATVNYWSANFGTIEYVKFLAGDVNMSKTITSADALRIQRYFVLEEGFVSPTPIWSYWKKGEPITNNENPYDKDSGTPLLPPWPTVITVTVNADVSDFDLYGMCTGDFNGSITTVDLKSASLSLTLTQNSNLQMGANQAFELPMLAKSAMQVSAVSMILQIPSNLVKVQDVIIKGSTEPALWTVKGNELRIGWYSLNPVNVAENGCLVTLKLMTSNAFTPGQSIDLELPFNPLNELADGNYEAMESASLMVAKVGNLTVGATTIGQDKGLSLSSYPNPFSKYTTLEYTLPVDGKVIINLYNNLGQLVSVLVDAEQTAGQHMFRYESNSLQPGIYLAKLRLVNSETEMVGTIKLSVQK